MDALNTGLLIATTLATIIAATTAVVAFWTEAKRKWLKSEAGRFFLKQLFQASPDSPEAIRKVEGRVEGLSCQAEMESLPESGEGRNNFHLFDYPRKGFSEITFADGSSLYCINNKKWAWAGGLPFFAMMRVLCGQMRRCW